MSDSKELKKNLFLKVLNVIGLYLSFLLSVKKTQQVF